MKKFWGFLLDLFVILLELAICAFLVFYLISHPITITRTITEVVKVRGGIIEPPVVVTPTPTPPPGRLNIPPVFWVPEYFAPEKQWGYDRVYSCTRLERVPGFWYIGGYPPPMINDCPVYVF